MRCPTCGVEAIEQAIYCHKCGERLDSPGGELARDSRPADEPASIPVEMFQQAASARRDAQEQPEAELWRGGYSSKAMIGAWAICALVDVALLIAGILWVRQATHWLILLGAMLLPWLYYSSILCYRRMSVRYLLSTQRFIHESGILRHVNDRIEVIDMDDITFEQGLLERLVGVGAIRIISSDRTNPEMVLQGIENVKKVAGLFDDARRTERRRRGLHVEQI